MHLGEIIQQRYFHSCFFNKETKKVFIMGGIDVKKGQGKNQLTWINSVEAMSFNPAKVNQGNFNWNTKSPLKKARSNFNGFSHGKSIYVFGGLSAVDTNENSVEKYDCENMESSLINFKTPNGFTGFPAYSVCFDNTKNANEFYIVGGSFGKNALKDVYLVNVDNNIVVKDSE